MSAVTKLNAHLSSITCPPELADLPAWLVWRMEYHEGEDKPRKVPYYVNGRRRAGTQGSPDDRQALATFAAARAAAARKGFDGVGFALMPDWGVVALDFDKCVAGGKIHPEVEEIAATSYAEFSPSGTGVRVLLKGSLPNRKSFDGEFGFETFGSKGFVTFTGNRLEITDLLGNDATLAPVGPEVQALVERRFPKRVSTATGHADEVLGLTAQQIEHALARLDPDMPHDDWLHVGMALHHETRGTGFEHWCDWSERGAKFPGRDVLLHRWDSFGKHDGPSVTGKTLAKMAGIPLTAPATPEDFEDMVQEARAKVAPGERPRFYFEPAATFSSAKGLPWIIKGVLPKAGLAVVYGASGSGKSFAVLDMTLAIARGIEWRGRRVRQSRVAYIAAEGADGFRKRLAAYAQVHALDLAGVPLTVLNAAPNLMEKQDAVDLAVGIDAAGGADIVVVDTFAQVMPGANENAGEDVGKALAHCRRLHELTGALVVLIHHSGKDAAKGARGWSGLKAAADAEIEVLREMDQRRLRLSKNKDGEDGLEWGFALKTVEIGVDEDLDPITSCVVEEADLTAMRPIGKPLGPVESVVYEVLREFSQAQSAGIEVPAVMAEVLRRMPKPEDGKRDTRKQRIRRALQALTSGDDAPFWMDGQEISVT